MFGLGSVNQDWSEALKCLRSASERGSIYATGMLALLYFFRSFYTLASRTAYTLVANTELQRRPTSSVRTSRISFSGKNDGHYLGERTFMLRAVTVACFIYALCLDRGLGVQRDSNAASAMYSKCIQLDPVTTSHLQDMVIRAEL
ncbi:unnamed protein product [Rodentolepis nana]|uniref:TPR_REGION domain-containing protein n=1 Tax=Rodentolepis nana TaxID=102285 RepID=A0A0R3TZ08_RODNA|nr:unnamed protein product [Rodentolepis nana]